MSDLSNDIMREFGFALSKLGAKNAYGRLISPQYTLRLVKDDEGNLQAELHDESQNECLSLDRTIKYSHELDYLIDFAQRVAVYKSKQAS